MLYRDIDANGYCSQYIGLGVLVSVSVNVNIPLEVE